MRDMKTPKVTFRDILALPFSFLGWLFYMMAVQVGGLFTSWVILKIWGLWEEKK
jgi:hypothetical protein